MKNTLLLVGNSHAACRYEAAKVFETAGIPREEISWICQGANVAPFAVDAERKTIRPNFSRQRSAIIEVYIRNGLRVIAEAIANDPGIPLETVETVVLSSVGVRPPGVMLDEHICHHMSKVPTSDALVRAWVRGQTLARVMPKLSALRKAGYRGRIFATPWVRPFHLPDFCSADIWQRYCELEQSALVSTLEEVQAVLLPYPPGAEKLTDIALTTGKAGVHGNRHYGEMINELLVRVAFPELQSAAPRQSKVA